MPGFCNRISRLYLPLGIALLSLGLQAQKPGEVSLVVLGTVQDGGSPHIGCQRSCCADIPEKRMVVSLGLVDHGLGASYLFEATPDMPAQVADLQEYSGKVLPDGIFLTHAHIGHYSGLQFLGKEALNAKAVPVYAMPRMERFLSENGPWGQLVQNRNISLHGLDQGQILSLGSRIEVEPFRVPHRDEYSETVGFIIRGPKKSALFIPDIDKWERWQESIVEKIREVDLAFVDATFFNAAEVGYRDISQIPHPMVSESMGLLGGLPANEKGKVYFIHMNHTNPLLDPESQESEQTLEAGFHIARKGQRFSL